MFTPGSFNRIFFAFAEIYNIIKYGLFFFFRPDGMGTITEEEQEEFEEIRVRLLTLLENQIMHFR